MTNCRKSLSILFLILCQLSVFGQDIHKDFLEKINVRNIGPAGMSGRVTAIDVDLSNEDRIFVGTASGGVWKSENGGISWEAIFDDAEILSVGSLKINQNNTDEIWVGTGEGNPRNSHNSGAGIFKSIDGGKNWTRMGLENTRIIHRIIIDQNNSETVYAGVLGSAWGDSSDRGVYKTIDGGKNWEKSLYVDQRTGVAEMVVDPNNPNKIFAAMWDFRRTPWDFTSGGKGSGLYMTVNGGQDWIKLTDKDGLPEGDLGRIGIAISRTKPNIIYALVEAEENGLYKSTDGGYNWNLVSTEGIGNRPFYYAELYVDTHNENRLFNLYTYLSRSEDGGKSFKQIADYGNSVHPDHHAFWQSPTNPLFLIDGNDGGMNISKDGGDTWRFISNLPVGQFYHVNVDDDFPYNVYGGMQDNGSWAGPGFALKAGGIVNHDWQELSFGDGFDVSPLPSDSRYGYSMSQGGNVGFYDKVTGLSRFVKPVIADTTRLRYNWNAPIAQDPFNDCGVYFGSQFVHYSQDCGESWETISPDLTTNDLEKQQQDKSGGLTIDATFAENHTTILCIAPSKFDNKKVWAGTDDGRLQLTIDGGESWKDVYNRLPGVPRNAWIPQIKLSEINPDEIFVVVNNYRMNDWTPYLYHSTNGGDTFKRIVDAQDTDGFVCSVLQDPEQENLLFLGTDTGLYISFDHGDSWTKWGKGFPNVQIRDLAFNQRFDDLVIGTFGRSFWILDDVEVLRAYTQDQSWMKDDIKLISHTDGYQTYRRSYQGIRFVAQGDFRGDNKSLAAKLAVWLKPKGEKEMEDKAKNKKEEEDEEEEEEQDEMLENDKNRKKNDKKKENVAIYVISMDGDTLRTLKPKLKEGLNEVYWRLDKKGVRGPSRSNRTRDGEPGGVSVLPGTYKLVLSKGDFKDSVLVEVYSDPRIESSREGMEKIHEANERYENIVTASKESFDQLNDAKKTIKLSKELLVNQPDSLKKDVTTLGDSLNVRVDSLMNLFNDPEGLKGIQRDPNTLGAMSWPTRAYMRGSLDGPTPNALLQLSKFESKAEEVIRQVNDFMMNEWKSYQEKVNGIPINLFKEHESIKIE